MKRFRWLDEWHTLFLGMYRVYNKDFNETRVGSTTRNLVILLSPLSVVYMNSFRGDNIIVGNLTHSYSGYWYIERAVENFPEIRFYLMFMIRIFKTLDFIIFLRNCIFLLSVLLIAYFFYKNSFKVTALIYITYFFKSVYLKSICQLVHRYDLHIAKFLI